MTTFKITVSELRRLLDLEPNGEANVAVFTSLSIHSEHVRTRGIFLALSGKRVDGHDYVAQALKNGAGIAICSRIPEGIPSKYIARLILVPDVIDALLSIAAYWRRLIRARVVVVTGSSGKTITKDALGYLLGSSHDTFISPTTFNSLIGAPLALLSCPSGSDFAVLEASLSEPDLGRRFARALDPDIIVVPSYSTRWSEKFPSREGQSIEFLRMGAGGSGTTRIVGFALGGDSSEELGPLLEKSGANVVIPPRQVAAGHLEKKGFTIFELSGATAHIRTPSEVIAEDVALAADVAAKLSPDLSIQTILNRLADYVPTASRIEEWLLPNGATVIRDLVTADPVPLRAAVRVAISRAHSSATPGVVRRSIIILQSPHDDGRYTKREAVDVASVLQTEKPDTVLALGRIAESLAPNLSIDVQSPDLHPFETKEELRVWVAENVTYGDVVLVQGSRTDWMENIAGDVVSAMAPNRLTIDLNAMDANLRELRRIVGRQTRLCAMVKALAYGTDPLPLAQALERFGVDCLAVSSADEGVSLRQGAINAEILVMLSNERDIERIARYRLTPVLYSPEMLQAYLSYDGHLSRQIDVHIEVDTGMHRTGFYLDGMSNALADTRRARNINVRGIMTHLGCADDPKYDGITHAQLLKFSRVREIASAMGYKDLIYHAAASSATLRFPEARLDMVRIGLALFGIFPSDSCRTVELRPVLTLTSKLVEISDVPPGEYVGYGATFVTSAPNTRIGVVSVGYHDCIPRSLSNSGHVDVLGVSVPIVGRVSMDSMTIDLTACPDARVGDDVVIYGGGSPIEAAAGAAGTIPYELMARIGPRVQRIFSGQIL